MGWVGLLNTVQILKYWDQSGYGYLHFLLDIIFLLFLKIKATTKILNFAKYDIMNRNTACSNIETTNYHKLVAQGVTHRRQWSLSPLKT